MAKTRPDRKKAKRREKSLLNGVARSPQKSSKAKPQEMTPGALLVQATDLLQISRPEEAHELAQQALDLLQEASSPSTSPAPSSALSSTTHTPATTLSQLPALNLIAEIEVELGHVDGARGHFLLAAELDPDGTAPEDAGGGAEKFLWLAQLSEHGGAESVGWFDRGAAALRQDIGKLEAEQERGGANAVAQQQRLGEQKRRLANALCAMAEVYMTDLSWEADAEQRCETLVTEAVLLTPDSAEALQTLASVRISQVRLEEARTALGRSLALWTDLEPDDVRVPDFPSRVSLARLLLETEMEEEAILVLERLIMEDDQSVEAWYLGGWGLYLLGARRRSDHGQNGTAVGPKEDEIGEEWKALWEASREWLQSTLKIFDMLDYEDERLKEHATDLTRELDTVLGEVEETNAGEESDGVEGNEDWEDDTEEEEGGGEADHENMEVS